MMKKRFISRALVLAMLIALMQSNSIAYAQEASKSVVQMNTEVEVQQDVKVEQKQESGPDKPKAKTTARVAVAAAGNTEVIYNTDGNKVNLRVSSGYDLDQYLFQSDSPINYDIDMKGFGTDSKKPAKITLRVWDVDQLGTSGYLPEVDKVYVNGTYLGNLTGADGQWSTVTFNIPAGVLTDGVNHFRVDVDTNNNTDTWAVEVDWAEITIPFSIEQTQARALNDITIKRKTSDDEIGDTIWSTSFDANGNATGFSKNDPVADTITSRQFKYEYTLDSWPLNAQITWEPKVKYSWKFYESSTNSGSEKELTGWKNSFLVTVPYKVGKYTLAVTLKIYNGNTLLNTEYRYHNVYVLYDDPVSSVSYADSATPKTAWLDIATDWAEGKSLPGEILTTINNKEYTNPLGWRYGYYNDYNHMKDDAVTLLENGAGKNSDCYVFRDVWRLLAGSLGVSTGEFDYNADYGFLTSTRPALDDNESANSFPPGSNKADRWNFGSHAIGTYNNIFYDTTFGLRGTNPESNIFAKGVNHYEQDGSITKRYYDRVGTGSDLLVYDRGTVGNGWTQSIYEEYSPKFRANLVQTATGSALGTEPKASTIKSATGSALEVSENFIGAFTGVYSCMPVDRDGNGFFDYLKADVQVDITEAGTYFFDANLLNSNGEIAALGTLIPEENISILRTYCHLDAGTHMLSFYFGGRNLRKEGLDGPYTVSIGFLGNGGELTFNSDAYTASQFQADLLEVNGFKDYGKDSNGDGKYDYLSSDINLNVLSDGTYEIRGWLFTGETLLAQTDLNATLVARAQTVTLDFDAERIFRNGLDGPYTVILNITDTEQQQFTYSTQAYLVSDFKAPIASIGNVTEGGADTNGNNQFDQLKITGMMNTEIPGTYYVSGRLEDDLGNTIDLSDVSVELTGSTADFSLGFDGKTIFQSLLDGPYQLILTVSDDAGNNINNMTMLTKAYRFSEFENPKISFTNRFSDTAIDDNSDGLINTLQITAEVTVAVSGNYIVQGSLHDKDGELITISETLQYLYEGTGQVSLNFDGRAIHDHGVDGPYQLLTLEVLSEDGATECNRIDAYQTTNYSCSQFQSATNSGGVEKYEDNGEDYDLNGLFDRLKISMEISVPQYDYYSFNARLVDSNNGEIQWASGSAYLNQGIQNITLEFDGRYLYANGVDGPYYLKDLSIYSSSQMFSVMDAYTTNAYQYTDFEPCSMISGTVTADGQPVPGANITIIGVDNDLTDAVGMYHLAVINGGTYEIIIDVDTSLGPWEIWINGSKVAEGYSTIVDIPNGQEVKVDFKSTKITDQPPVLEPIGNKIINEMEMLEFTLKASDPDGKPITYAAENLPNGAVFDTVTGIFRWTPDYSQSGTYQGITFTVSDGSLMASETIDIIVNNVNRAPIIEPVENLTVKENQAILLKLAMSDPDGDVLKISTHDAPEGSAFDPETMEFTWTPNFTQAGSYKLGFEVSDGSLTEKIAVSITVNNVTSKELITELKNYITSLKLHKNLEKSLLKNLTLAEKDLSKGKYDHAIIQMKGFIIKVQCINSVNSNFEGILKQLNQMMNDIIKKYGGKYTGKLQEIVDKVMYQVAYSEMNKLIAECIKQKGRIVTPEEADYMLQQAEDIIFAIGLENKK